MRVVGLVSDPPVKRSPIVNVVSLPSLIFIHLISVISGSASIVQESFIDFPSSVVTKKVEMVSFGRSTDRRKE